MSSTAVESSSEFDAEENASVLASVFKESGVYLGGSATGKGFRRSARYYLQSIAPKKKSKSSLSRDENGVYDEDDDDDEEGGEGEAGDIDLLSLPDLPPEDPFYVVDLGVVVFQYYNWCRHFPRVQPYYAVKCNPDPVIIKTLALLGANFDCASRQEIRLVRTLTRDLPQKPDIIYANPCKSRSHIVDALKRGVTLMTFDNEEEVRKCASVSKSKIRLVLRIITDDAGATSRLSLKFGAPKSHWRNLLSVARECGMQVVGVSFHVGSGCKDETKYELALKDARELFNLAKKEFGFDMTILDIGGGFPGETHSLWNPELRDATNDDEKEDDEEDEEDLHDNKEEKKDSSNSSKEPAAEAEEGRGNPVLFFNEIAASVAPVLDRLFPEESGVTLIAEPGRYLVASCATLLVNVTSVRKNVLEGKGTGKKGDDDDDVLHPYSDREAAEALNALTREEEVEIVHGHGSGATRHPLFRDVMKGIQQVSQRFARQSLAQQEVDVFGDRLDLGEAIDESVALTDDHGLPVPEVLPVGPEEAEAMDKAHTAEGVSAFLVDEALEPDEGGSGYDASAKGGPSSPAGRDRAPSFSSEFVALAAAGEAAVAGAVLEAVSSVAPASDDYAYYVNDGVYGAFNCIMFDHAVVRPRLLKNPARGGSSYSGSGSGPGEAEKKRGSIVQASLTEDGFRMLDASSHPPSSDGEDDRGGGGTTTNGSKKDVTLYSSTVFGPSCDSIDVVSRSVLLPKLDVGDWLYFNNMGAYTSAAASSFNGFDPSDKFYVCSVRPENIERMIEGPPEE